MTKSSLIIVGSGIKFLAHLTIEAEAHIKAADKVLYLVNEPAMQAWLNKNHANAESLDNLYFKNELRRETYNEITQYILETLKKFNAVCVVLYGHPTVFSKPALDAALIAKQKGYYTEILPGISTEDCMFADLLIDPGSAGCLSFEATNLIVYRKKIDTSCHVIIWQIGVIGALGHAHLHDNKKGILLLTDHLIKFYPPRYEIILYQASQYAGFKPSIKRIKLDQLPAINLPRLTSLYIPPAHQPYIDTNILKTLGIKKE